jgi:hypothetical protein
MGWQDRDYAKWSDDERKRYFGASGSQPVQGGGSTAGKALAIGISALAIFGGSAFHFGFFGGSHHSPTPVQRPTPLPPGTRLVCTERSINPATGKPHCTTYTYVNDKSTPT